MEQENLSEMNFIRENLRTAFSPCQRWGKESITDGIRSQLNFGWTFDSYWSARKCPNHKLSLQIILQYFPVGLHQRQRDGTQKAGDRAGVLRNIIHNMHGTYGARQGLPKAGDSRRATRAF